MRVSLVAIALVVSIAATNAQPLVNPFTFSFAADTQLDTNLLSVQFEKAGARGNVKLTTDGHLGFADGSRLRIVGTNLQWGGIWPDSSNAILMARRFRALGINCVRFNAFDYPFWSAGSILADGQSSTANGLGVEQMKKFDWFMHQLRENGVYYVFTFHSVWLPRPEDGVRQPDSTGWGSRMSLIFDAQVQKIHRSIMKLLLEHVNPHTGLAYKSDPALAYIIAAEDASLIAFWLYTADVIRPNPGANASSGSQHIALIDSLWISWLRKKGYTTDGALNSAWTVLPTSSANMLRNGGFEDPFSAAWTLGVSAEAQAVLQFSDADKKEGTASGRVRINVLNEGKQSYGINLYQRLTAMKRLARYQLSFWAKTTAARGTRSMLAYAYNGTFPYDNYGLNQTIAINSQWQQFAFSFTSRASDESTANLSFFLGADSGDVFLDDIVLKEVATPGLFAGESVERKAVPRNIIQDDRVSSTRYRDNSAFHYEYLRAFYLNVRKMVRDTLKSDVLMCPSARMISFYEINAAREYEVFSGNDWRNAESSMLSEAYGGSVYAVAQNKVQGKAFVLSHSSIAYPRPYQAEMATVLPAYAGLQDWDGVYFSVFTETPVAGAVKADSNSYWNIYDKPNVLCLLPSVASMMRNADVKTSLKEIVIDNTQEVIDQPRLHVQQAFSLSTSPDSRMPLFRRVSMNPNVAVQESFLPHRDISALSDQVDVAALDAENGQIFWDATKAAFRVETPRYMAISGGTVGQIITLPSIILEQTSKGVPPSVSIASLTTKPIVESEKSLLVISSRALNTGTIYNPVTQLFTTWGNGPMQMEGVTMRVTITAPLFDSLLIHPLSSQGVRKGISKKIARGAGGRFSTTLNTQTDETPWYQLELVRTSTSVDDVSSSSAIRVFPNPVVDGRLVVGFPQGANNVRMFDVNGAEWARKVVDGTSASIDVSTLTSGAYLVSVYHGLNIVGTSTVVVP